VRCQRCREVIDFPGQVHACRPPSATVPDLALATRRTIGSAVLFAASTAAASAMAAAAPAVRGSVAGVSWLTIGTAVVGLIALGSLVGLIVSAAVWAVAAHRLTRVHGSPAYGHRGFWGLGSYAVALVASFLILPAALRTAGTIALAAGMWHTLAWMRRQAGPGPEPGEAGDWDAGVWDPQVLDEIERRRGRSEQGGWPHR
jgi:hypothetical protein